MLGFLSLVMTQSVLFAAAGTQVPLTSGAVIKLTIWFPIDNAAPGTPATAGYSYFANIMLVRSASGAQDGIIRYGDTISLNSNTPQNTSAIWSAQPDGRLEINRSQVDLWEYIVIQPTHRSQVLNQPVNFGDPRVSFNFANKQTSASVGTMTPSLLTVNTGGILGVNTPALTPQGTSNSTGRNGTQFHIQKP